MIIILIEKKKINNNKRNKKSTFGINKMLNNIQNWIKMKRTM